MTYNFVAAILVMATGGFFARERQPFFGLTLFVLGFAVASVEVGL